jgi:3-methyl-2-oxobutanoate hydroxymethyltransferase
MKNQKVTVPGILEMKARGEKIAALTAYDATMARILDQAGIDLILVGDSVGMVVSGFESTLPVTLEQMIYHTKAVSRGVKRALLVADMPFLSFQVSTEKTIENAGRLLKEGGAEAVKIEGGEVVLESIAKLVEFGIPVMGHIGLTPQSVNQLGGFKVQRERERLLADARALADAGAFALVIECVPSDIGAAITAAVAIPTIGIGAGPDCDGQVLVFHDLLGLFDRFRPSFVKQYADIGGAVTTALKDYHREVKEGAFPTAEYSFK